MRPGGFPNLEAQLRQALLVQACLALAKAVAILAIVWSGGQMLFVVFQAPAWSSGALALGLLSLLPLGLAWPGRPSLLPWVLRNLDPSTTFEALREAPPGPARDLLERRAQDTDRALASSLAARGILEPIRKDSGLRRLLGLALASLLVLQGLSLVLLSRPLLAWRGPEVQQGSGLSLSRHDPGSRARPGDEAQEEEGASLSPSSAPRASDPTGARDEGLSPGRAARQAPRGVEAVPGLRKEGEARLGLGPEGEAGAKGQGQGEEAPRADEGRQGPSRGYEAASPAAGQSPLVDYLSRLYGAATSSRGEARTATRELGLGELRDYSRRYFGAFRQSPGLEGRDGAEVLLLKARWRQILGKKP